MDEKKVSAEFVSIFSERFDLYPEVRLRHPLTGKDLSIDFVGFEKADAMMGPIGFEIKDPDIWNSSANGQSFGNFTNALAQCCDYQDRLINTQFKTEAHRRSFGQRLRFTFLYPVDEGWAYGFRAADTIVARWGAGALRLAGKFGVGAACKSENMGWILTIGTMSAYTIKSGPNELFTRHAVATRSGSSR